MAAEGKDTRLAVRAQTAKVMQEAQSLLGSRKALAEYLGVYPHNVVAWLDLTADAPHDIVKKAADKIVSVKRRR